MLSWENFNLLQTVTNLLQLLPDFCQIQSFTIGKKKMKRYETVKNYELLENSQIFINICNITNIFNNFNLYYVFILYLFLPLTMTVTSQKNSVSYTQISSIGIISLTLQSNFQKRRSITNNNRLNLILFSGMWVKKKIIKINISKKAIEFIAGKDK